MFETAKTLIVVYKDEMLMNQFRKLVESHDDRDSENIVETRNDSINIVSWTEKVWLGNKKAGNIKGKVLFLGDIKGTDKLVPVIDIKFEKYGVKYGWAGNQAVLVGDIKGLANRDGYNDFLEELSKLQVPDIVKGTKKESSDDETKVETTEEKVIEKKEIKNPIMKNVKNAIDVGADKIGKAKHFAATKAEDIFKDRKFINRQMLFYGVVYLYNDGLEEFMNM